VRGSRSSDPKNSRSPVSKSRIRDVERKRSVGRRRGEKMKNEITRRSVLVAGAASALTSCRLGDRGLGVAVVGLGGVATGQILPALRDTKHCHLAALVSSSADKLREEGAKYGISEDSLYTYDEFDRIAMNPSVDIVHIALPNALHAEYAIRAARAGKHVLCEKPLAASVAQAQAMIAASNAAGKYLAVAYRTHHSRHHEALRRLAREQTFGRLKCIRASIGFGIEDDWRLDLSLAGGGVLLEQGVYAVNTARNLVGALPVEVFGHQFTTDPARYSEVEESVMWTMRFDGGEIAQCAASYSMPMNALWVGASRGMFELDPAYSYGDVRGFSSAGAIAADSVNQFVEQADDFAFRIRNGVSLEGNSGDQGLVDLHIIDAVYKSIAAGEPVAVANVAASAGAVLR
jgi:predicted dehydrogenase